MLNYPFIFSFISIMIFLGICVYNLCRISHLWKDMIQIQIQIRSDLNNIWFKERENSNWNQISHDLRKQC